MMTPAPPAWTCPLCRETIKHYEYAPRDRVTYRCPTCRFDLLWNSDRREFAVAPFQAAAENRRCGEDRRGLARGGRRVLDVHGGDR